MVDPETWIENGIVEVSDGRVVSVGRADMRTGTTDHGPGVIMPALGNAHTHLSLSYLKDRVDTENGFIPWVKSLIHLREMIPGGEAESTCTAAAATMKYLASLEDVTIVPAHCPEAADELLGDTWRSRDGHSTRTVVPQR